MAVWFSTVFVHNERGAGAPYMTNLSSSTECRCGCVVFSDRFGALRFWALGCLGFGSQGFGFCAACRALACRAQRATFGHFRSLSVVTHLPGVAGDDEPGEVPHERPPSAGDFWSLLIAFRRNSPARRSGRRRARQGTARAPCAAGSPAPRARSSCRRAAPAGWRAAARRRAPAAPPLASTGWSLRSPPRCCAGRRRCASPSGRHRTPAAPARPKKENRNKARLSRLMSNEQSIAFLRAYIMDR
eukprot:1180891-Prorocentrum_minimum.AAC.1